MGCGTGIVKFVMFLFNFAFVVGGIIMVVFGSLVLSGYNSYEHVVKLDAYRAPPILMIVIGSIVFLIAFMGCCGVLRENNCMMMTYAVFLSILLIAQVGIAVGATIYEDDFKGLLKDGLEKSLKEYYNKKEIKETWDSMQSNLKCCGYESYKNWSPNEVPDSCCLKRTTDCARGAGSDPSPGDRIYTQGCVDKVFSDLKIRYVIIAAAVIAGIELLGIMFACCLGARFRRKNYA